MNVANSRLPKVVPPVPVQSEATLLNYSGQRALNQLKRNEIEYRARLIRNGKTPEQVNNIVLPWRLKRIMKSKNSNSNINKNNQAKLTRRTNLRRRDLTNAQIENTILRNRIRKLNSQAKDPSPEEKAYLTKVLKFIKDNPELAASTPDDPKYDDLMLRILHLSK
jgi:hypothetical protein